MKKRKKKVGVMWWVALMLCLAMIICSGAYFVMYFQEATEVGSLYDEIADIHDRVLFSDESTVVTPIQVIVGDTVVERTFLAECKELYEINNEMVGWLSIPDTTVNYPVAQTTKSNRDYYLYHDFEKNYDRYGCLYASEDCDVFKPSDNITIYGHHMTNGTMFAYLTGYDSYQFWEKHPTFTFDTLYEHHTYQVAVVFKIPADSPFRYHMFVDAETEADFNVFVREIRSRQFYDTGIDLNYGDKLVCLSTCEYTLNDGRFVVVGKRIS